MRIPFKYPANAAHLGRAPIRTVHSGHCWSHERLGTSRTRCALYASGPEVYHSLEEGAYDVSYFCSARASKFDISSYGDDLTANMRDIRARA